VVDLIGEHAQRVVYLSSAAVLDDLQQQLDPNGRVHSEVERLIARSGLEWTILRSHVFAAKTLRWAGQIRAEGLVREPYGAAAMAPVHERDIAAVAVRALTEDGHDGATYELTGPELVTQAVSSRSPGPRRARSPSGRPTTPMSFARP
jgi:uncharacterized protein YbjT (DUF2867 family)